MEVRFCHWIKNKTSYCDFLSHNTDFFHRITRYKLANLILFFFSQLRVYITQFWLYRIAFFILWWKRASIFISQNFEKKSGLWGKKKSQKSVEKKVRTVSLYLKSLWRKKSQNCEFISQKSVEKKKSEYFLYYSVAETGFHTHFRYLSLSKKKLWSLNT